MNDVLTALADASRLIDEAITAACVPLTVGVDRPGWSRWEIDQSLRDIALLSNGDCCYDRPSIGVAYALWHHGSRTHDAIRMLLPVMERHGQEEICLVDLGCGTGATASAAALIVAAMRRAGKTPPRQVVVLGVDQSSFMTDMAQRVQASLLGRVSAPEVRASFVAARWEELEPSPARTVITAGYLLDHSDGAHADEISERLEVLALRLDAEEVVVTTVGAKRRLLEQVGEAMRRREWQPADVPMSGPVAGRGLEKVGQLRARWYRDAGVTREPSGYLDRRPEWHKANPVALALQRSAGPVGGRLFDSTPTGLELDDAQREAAVPTGGPTAIVGPAGSGKTLVLAERVALTVTDPQADPRLHILVTAFNKAVVALLIERVADALNVRGVAMTQVDDEGHRWTIHRDGRQVDLSFYNRDKLPTRVFGCSPVRIEHGGWTREVVRRRGQLTPDEVDRLKDFDVAALETEFERFIVAKGHPDVHAYVRAPRAGSGRALGERQRETIWKLVMDPPIPSHGSQRLRSASRSPPRPFTHVFVDECQDFGEAELRQLARSAASVDRLCIAGDVSQSIHLGPSYVRPTFEGVRWRLRQLEGSHRLPLRICEALRPQAERLVARRTPTSSAETDAVLLGPRKASLLGVRPIVVLAEDLRHELPAILGTYDAAVDDKRLLVGDARPWVTTETKRAAPTWNVEAGSMLKYKGCEWPVVVMTDAWSGHRPVDDADLDLIETLEQHAFTVLTRSTRVLIIALARDGNAVHAVSRFLGHSPVDRLLFWTEEAQQRFAALTPAGRFAAYTRAR
ncbi:DNA helicase [Paraconexibacter sp. AEG42_29]|uniref:DNA helicase n=1 Tax=Paraconexibacter sp. AEG42_29 TaxID=2997339 RepID=A0AAU7B2F8_9ACTN